ncbi:hypothetical protein ACJRW5_17610 [Pseudomonas sp. SH1-B]
MTSGILPAITGDMQTTLLLIYKISRYRFTDLWRSRVTVQAPRSDKTDNPHVEAAERFRQLAQVLAGNPAEAKVFRVKTGVYNAKGELKAAYR